MNTLVFIFHMNNCQFLPAGWEASIKNLDSSDMLLHMLLQLFFKCVEMKNVMSWVLSVQTFH